MAGDHHRYTEVLRQPRGCVASRESEVRVNDVWPPIGPAAAQLASNTARHGQSLQPGGELWNRQIAWIADADIAVDHGLAFNRAPALLSGRPAAKPLGEVRHRHHDANIGMLGQRLRSLQTESTCRGGLLALGTAGSPSTPSFASRSPRWRSDSVAAKLQPFAGRQRCESLFNPRQALQSARFTRPRPVLHSVGDGCDQRLSALK